MFASINIDGGGYIVARADMIGMVVDEIERVNANQADAQLLGKVRLRLHQAAMNLYNLPHEGLPC